MKPLKRDTLIDIVLWLVIITQVIFLGFGIFIGMVIASWMVSSKEIKEVSDISIHSSAEQTNSVDQLRTEYLEFRNQLEEKVKSMVPYPEPVVLEGRDLYISYIYEIASKYSNVRPELFIALVENESRFNPEAVNYNGTCVGLCQLSVKWHTKRAGDLGVSDLFDPYGNLLTGIDYFSDLMESANGSEELAVMLYHMRADAARSMYNNGYVDSYTKLVIAMSKEL